MIDFKDYCLGRSYASFSIDETKKNLILLDVEYKNTKIKKIKNEIFKIDEVKDKFCKELVGLKEEDAITYHGEPLYKNKSYQATLLYLDTHAKYYKTLNEKNIQKRFLDKNHIALNDAKLKAYIHDFRIRDHYKIIVHHLLKDKYRLDKVGNEKLSFAIALSSYQNGFINLQSNSLSEFSKMKEILQNYAYGFNVIMRIEDHNITSLKDETLLKLFDNIIYIQSTGFYNFEIKKELPADYLQLVSLYESKLMNKSE